MAYNSGNPNGQTTASGSTPVVIASDQTTVKVKLANDLTATTGTITSATSTVVATSLVGVGSVTVSVYGTYSGVNFTHEGYDGVNWIALPAQPLGTTFPTMITGTGVLTANTVAVWNVTPLLGLQQFRVRATAWTSGTANIIISPSAQFTHAFTNTIISSMPSVTLAAGTNTAGGTFSVPSASAAGLTIFSNQALTATVVQVGATGVRRMYEYDFYNPNSTGVWIQMFNAATATLGTTTPNRTIYIPPTSGRDWTSPYSVSWSTALSIACTTTNTGNTAPTTAIQAYIGYV